MFGGRKFNKNSELLRSSAAPISNSDSGVTSVNDSMFQKVAEAENHSRLILKNGQTNYIRGIKDNVLDLVKDWLQLDHGNVFSLYGKMGCGKSFFSARIWEIFSKEKDLYQTVAFSSQQLYRDTTNLRNMLLSLAHQLFDTVPCCGE